MYDRAMQALYALALDPVSETTADTKSFGFRKGRCAQDACECIFTALSRSFSPQWVLEGDIKGCFDHISHDWLVEHIPMDKSVLKQFLKAGFVFREELFPTDEGTPQGGVISPILANMALDGMQQVLSDHFDLSVKGEVSAFVHNKSKVNLVRYADDFIVTAATKRSQKRPKRSSVISCKPGVWSCPRKRRSSPILTTALICWAGHSGSSKENSSSSRPRRH